MAIDGASWKELVAESVESLEIFFAKPIPKPPSPPILPPVSQALVSASAMFTHEVVLISLLC